MNKTTVCYKVSRKQTIAYLKEAYQVATPVLREKKPEKDIDKMCRKLYEYSARIDALLAHIRLKLRRG